MPFCREYQAYLLILTYRHFLLSKSKRWSLLSTYKWLFNLNASVLGVFSINEYFFAIIYNLKTFFLNSVVYAQAHMAEAEAGGAWACRLAADACSHVEPLLRDTRDRSVGILILCWRHSYRHVMPWGAQCAGARHGGDLPLFCVDRAIEFF